MRLAFRAGLVGCMGCAVALVAAACAQRDTAPRLADAGSGTRKGSSGSGTSSEGSSAAGASSEAGASSSGSSGGAVLDAAMACSGGCDDGIDCTDDSCNASTGLCAHAPNHSLCKDPAASFCDRAAGCSLVHCTSAGACDDGLACNGAEQCVSGQCAAGQPPSVDDGVACTQDSCEEPGRIVHKVDHASCDDGKFCNGVEHCDPSAGCQPGTPPPLDDGVACTTDACDESTKAITHTPDNGKCDDGDMCTRDRCSASGCAHPHDGNACPCTPTSSCDPFDTSACGTQACRPTSSGNECQALNSPYLAADAPCPATADQFSCARGTLCADVGDGPSCHRLCRKDTVGTCPSGEACTGVLSTDSCVQICLPYPKPCDPLAQDCANSTDTCTFASNPETGEPYMGCRPAGTRSLGQTCGGSVGTCGHKLVCLTTDNVATCRQLCDPNASNPACSEPGKTCTGVATTYKVSFCQ